MWESCQWLQVCWWVTLGLSSFLHYLQLASHDLSANWPKKWQQKWNSNYSKNAHLWTRPRLDFAYVPDWCFLSYFLKHMCFHEIFVFKRTTPFTEQWTTDRIPVFTHKQYFQTLDIYADIDFKKSWPFRRYLAENISFRKHMMKKCWLI